MVRYLLVALVMVGVAFGQEATQEQPPKKYVPKVVPVPVPKVAPMTPEPDPSLAAVKELPARAVKDAKAGVELRLPAGWRMETKDGEMSTFHLDARSAAANAQLRMVAMLGYNPFPRSTFSGAIFYLSTARTTAAECGAETTTKPDTGISGATIDEVKFRRGKDEHGRICTQARDIAYTTMRGRTCVRFDLAVNTFCGGEVSGVKDITDEELSNVFGRMEGILQTVKFVGK